MLVRARHWKTAQKAQKGKRAESEAEHPLMDWMNEYEERKMK
jgi:hypothetical protein